MRAQPLPGVAAIQPHHPCRTAHGKGYRRAAILQFSAIEPPLLGRWPDLYVVMLWTCLDNSSPLPSSAIYLNSRPETSTAPGTTPSRSIAPLTGVLCPIQHLTSVLATLAYAPRYHRDACRQAFATHGPMTLLPCEEVRETPTWGAATWPEGQLSLEDLRDPLPEDFVEAACVAGVLLASLTIVDWALSASETFCSIEVEALCVANVES